MYCPHIKNLSKVIYDYCSRVFNYKLPVSEIGITNHLIYDMMEFYSGSSLLDCYSIHAKNEHLRGADIDLFLSDGNGKYIHFMLQAKVMNYRGRYMDISKWNPIAQYRKLIKVANKEGAIPLYLLYNGDALNATLCTSTLGLSILDANQISDFRKNQHRTSYTHGLSSLHFDCLHPLGIRPYSDLFCDNSDWILKATLKTEDDIYIGFPYVKLGLTEDDNLEEELEIKENALVANKKKLGRFRIIVRE